jgi:hypothetical protein
MQTSIFKNPDCSITQVTHDESSGQMELLVVDSKGRSLSKTIYLYENNRLQEYTQYDEENAVLKKVVMSYGPGPWDGQSQEFNFDGHLLKLTKSGWDSENKCKVHFYYDSVGSYLGKALEKLDEDGKFRGLKYFDKDGNKVDSEP